MDEGFLTGPLLDSEPDDEDFIEDNSDTILSNLTKESVDKFFERKERKLKNRLKEWNRLRLRHYSINLHWENLIAPLSLRNQVAARIVNEGLSVDDSGYVLSDMLQDKVIEEKSNTDFHYGTKLQYYHKRPKTWCLQWATEATASEITSLETLQASVDGTAKQEVLDYFYSKHAAFEPAFTNDKWPAMAEQHERRKLKAMRGVYKTLVRRRRDMDNPESHDILKKSAEELKEKISDLKNSE